MSEFREATYQAHVAAAVGVYLDPEKRVECALCSVSVQQRNLHRHRLSWRHRKAFYFRFDAYVPKRPPGARAVGLAVLILGFATRQPGP